MTSSPYRTAPRLHRATSSILISAHPHTQSSSSQPAMISNAHTHPPRSKRIPLPIIPYTRRVPRLKRIFQTLRVPNIFYQRQFFTEHTAGLRHCFESLFCAGSGELGGDTDSCASAKGSMRERFMCLAALHWRLVFFVGPAALLLCMQKLEEWIGIDWDG